MKNGFSPREFAHSLAVDALYAAYHNKFKELDGLPPAQQTQAKAAIEKLWLKLAADAKLDPTPLRK